MRFQLDHDNRDTPAHRAVMAPERTAVASYSGRCMSERRTLKAKGPTQFDLLGMSDGAFESMNARLIRLEFPTAVKPANVSDGGADMVLPRKEGAGYARCWQSKHYPKNIRWAKCEKSLADARKHWNPERYTFIFPRELTVGEQKTFDEKFGSLDIPVDYWNGEELQTRLTGSDAGERVARHFFDDAELDRERTYQAIEAGRRLDTLNDGLDRLANLGRFAAERDAYFSYPGVTHEQDGPGPPLTPGTVMSVAEGDGKVIARYDVVPRDEEAMERFAPEFTLEPAEGEMGERASELLQQALSEGKGIQIAEGIDFTFTQLPPGLEHLVGQRMTGGQIVLGQPELVRLPIPPWHAHVTAGEASVDVRLTEMTPPPKGWDLALSGSAGGLTATMLFRRHGEGGQMTLSFRYARSAALVGEQLAALLFLRALTTASEVVVSDEGKTGRPELHFPPPVGSLPPEFELLIGFLENVRTIEEWAEVEYTLPEDITAPDAHSVAVVAGIIRAGGWASTWEHFELTMPAGQVEPLRGGHAVRCEQAMGANVLGRTVELGYAQFEVVDFRIASERPASGRPGEVEVRIEPGSDAAANVFQRLVRQPTQTRP